MNYIHPIETVALRPWLSARRLSLLCLLGAAAAVSACGGASGGSTPAPTATVAAVTVTPASPSIAVGATQQFTATAKDASGNTLTGVTFTWASSATNVATVNSSGLATGVAAGTASITAASGGITSAADSLTVTAPPVASITLAPASPSIAVGATQQFTATAKDASGNTLTGVTFTWASSATNVATVNGSGLATGVAAGTASITAASGGITSTADTLTVTQPAAVTGTAAQGAAIADATITLKDATGASRTTTSAADGTFSLDTSGLTPPFFLMAQPTTGNPLYSVSASADTTATINLDPLTDLIIRSWYSAQGLSVDTAFANPTAAPPPTPAQVQLLSHLFLTVTQLWLANNGLDTSTFDLIATPFAANGAGFDKVLDETTLNPSTGTITITDGTTTQATTVTYTTASATVSVNSTTTSGGNTSVSSNSTIVPAQSTAAAALAGINTTLSAFTQTVNSQGAQLAASDLAPYLDPGLLQDGLNADLFADSSATSMRGQTISAQVLAIDSLQDGNTVASVDLALSIATGGSQTTTLSFKNESGVWLFYGDQRIGAVNLSAEMRVNQGAQSSTGPEINLDFQPLQGTVTGITVTGGGIWDATPFTKSGTVDNTYAPTPTTTEDVISDHFILNSGILTTLVPAGTSFSFTVTPASGAPVSYAQASNAFTTEAIAFTGLTSSSIASLSFGQPLAYQWTLPTTFAVAGIQLTAQLFTGDQSDPNTVNCQAQSSPLAANATSGTVTLPAICDGQPVLQVNIELVVTGVNGQRENVIYFYQ